MTQINPPFDGSAPCPGCNEEVRGVSAYVHNFLTRCDVKASCIREGKAWVRLADLRKHKFPLVLTIPHPAVQELADVAQALAEACAGMVDEGLKITWPPETRAKVEALIPRAAAAMDAWDAVSEAHFADRRHSSGQENVLWPSAGSKWAGFVNPDYKAAGYNYTVDVVDQDGDLLHTVCGTHLKLHDHFKQKIAADPLFYGKVRCPRCSVDAPIAQFKREATT